MGVSAGWKRAGLLGLCLLLLLSPLTVRAADREARELTGECAVVWSGSEQAQPLALPEDVPHPAPALAAAGWVVIRRRRPLPPGPSRKTEETTPREDVP